MRGYINKIDFINLEAMKYWSFTANTPDSVKKTTVQNAIFSQDYIGSLKVDGFYQRLVKDEDGNCFMVARNKDVKGNAVDKYGWVPQLHSWLESFPNGTCFLSEVYLPNNEGSKNVTTILGCLKEKALAKQKETPLHLHIFDIMAYNGKSLMDTPYAERAQFLSSLDTDEHKNPYVSITKFFEGEELWNNLQAYLSEGREGMVIMRKDAVVYQKRTPARVSIKVKKELKQTIDCFFTGRTLPSTREYTGKAVETWQYWFNSVTNQRMMGDYYADYHKGEPIIPITKGYFYGWAGSLEIGVITEGTHSLLTRDGYRLDNVDVVPIGWLSNISEDLKKSPESYSFKPIEVTAMELDFSVNPPSLRHGKMLNWRTDLTIADCLLNKIV